MTAPEGEWKTPVDAGSRVDAGPKTQSGPLGRIDPPKSAPRGTVPRPPGAVPRPPVATATGTVVVGFVGLVASLVVLGSLAEGVRAQEVFALDTWATPFLHSIASPGLDALMNGLTTMGSSLVLIPIFVVVVAALLLRRRYGAALFLSVASGGALVIDATMKVVFQRPRPKLDYAAVLPDYSFPSGHSMNGVVFYVALALIAWSVLGRRLGVILVVLASILAFWIGVSRIYLGYHYLTDVVGGFLAGIVWLLVVGAAFRARPKIWRWGYVEPTSAPEPPPTAGPPSVSGPPRAGAPPGMASG
jgi:undecaprenyl-diphosphatase